MSEGTEGTFMLVPDWTPHLLDSPTHPNSDKRHLYSTWAWKPLWGLLSLQSYTQFKKKKNVCAPRCGKFVRGKQSVKSGILMYRNEHE